MTPNSFFIYPCISECINRGIEIDEKQIKCIINIGLQQKKSKDEILQLLAESEHNYDQIKIGELIESVAKDRNFGIPDFTCVHLRSAFGYSEDDCLTTRCKYASELNRHVKQDVYTDFCEIDLDDALSHSRSEVHFEAPIFFEDGTLFYTVELGYAKFNSTEGNEKYDNIKLLASLGDWGQIGCSPLNLILKKDPEGGKTINSNICEPRMFVTHSTRYKCANQEHNIRRYIQIRRKIGETFPQDTNEVFSIKPILKDTIPKVQDLENKLKYYLHLDDSIEHLIATCWLIGTYIFPIFSAYPYLVIRGVKGSGKGTFLLLISKTAWNSTPKMITTTEATIFRRIEEQKPTYIIDEYHRALKNKITGPATETILEAGFEKGTKVPRLNKVKDDFVEVEHEVYCPKAIATRITVEAEDKAIVIVMPKTRDNRYAQRRRELDNDPFFDEIRFHLIDLAVNKYKLILDSYRSFNPTESISGRDFLVWNPILAVCNVIFPECFEQLLDFAEKRCQEKLHDSDEYEDQLLDAVYTLYSENKLLDGGKKLHEPSLMLTNKAVYELNNMHHSRVRSAVQNLKLSGAEEHRKEGKVYFLKRKRLFQLFRERGYKINSQEEKSDSDDGKGSQINFEDIPILTALNCDEILGSYDILLENNELNMHNFVDQLSQVTESSIERCWAVYMYLKSNNLFKLSPEGHLHIDHNFRELYQKTRREDI